LNGQTNKQTNKHANKQLENVKSKLKCSYFKPGWGHIDGAAFWNHGKKLLCIPTVQVDVGYGTLLADHHVRTRHQIPIKITPTTFSPSAHLFGEP